MTTSLYFSCKSLGHPCIFRFFSNSFSFVLISNSITSSLGGRGSFAYFKGLLEYLNTHSMTLLMSPYSSISFWVDLSGVLYTFFPVIISPFSGGGYPHSYDLVLTPTDMVWHSTIFCIFVAWSIPCSSFDIMSGFSFSIMGGLFLGSVIPLLRINHTL